MASRYSTNVGSTLAEILAQKKLRQVDLAGQIGQPKSYVSQIATGSRKPSSKWLELVANTLGLAPEERQRLHIAGAKDNGFLLDLTPEDE